jgi:type I restriction enzyme S subunit
MKKASTKDTESTKEKKDLRPLPEGWEWTILGDALKWGSGGTPLRSNRSYYEGGDIPWVIIGDLNDGVVIDTRSKITKKGLENSSAKWVEEGSVLVAMYGSIGKLGIAGRQLTTNQAIAFTKPDPVNAKYLFYYLMGERQNLLNMGVGATQQNISQTVIKAYPFPLAPLTEQKRIVARLEELLSDLDAGVAALERVRAGVKRYKASVLKAACDGKLFGEKGIENGELPEGWRWATLDEFASDANYGTSQKCDYSENEFPVVRIPNIVSGDIDLADLKYAINGSGLREKDSLMPGDLLIIRTNGSRDLIGKSALVRKAWKKPLYFASYLIRYRIKDFENAGLWIATVWESPFIRTWLEKVVSTTAGQYNLNIAKLNKLPIPLPLLEEQRRILAEVEVRLESARAVEAAVEVGLKRAARLRQAVLKAAFEGKLL